jgi:prepilin signal peptidase PulO-like enzyme (type II secretory pathway)
MARWLITLGVVLIVLGLLWPLVTKLGLGNLPGDIRIERKGYTFYFPITTGLLISLVLTLILWILRRW